jgi:signal transduction histidine kinase
VKARNLEFNLVLINRETPVLADRVAIRRLLAILVDNAVKYTPPLGTIELRIEEQADYAVLSVRDSGIGIAEEDQARIFERFYRVDKARSRELGGAGIGLSIAQWIVQQHRGSITVLSAPGQGSTFRVSFPLHLNQDYTIRVDGAVSQRSEGD